MKKNFLVLMAGIFLLAVIVLVPSCRKELYTDEDALEAMKEAIKYKNDLEKELMALQLTNQLQIIGLQSQLSLKERQFADSLNKIGATVSIAIQVQDVTGNTNDMSGFSVTTNQGGVAKTLTTDANGFVLFPNCVSGTASFIVSRTGFARAAGILLLGVVYENEQKAVIVPVFPTTSATAKISGVLTAQLDLLTEADEPVKDGIISINFNDVFAIYDNPNSTIDELSEFGLAGLVYDGGFMQTVKTGADGKYEFLIPKTKQNITYKLDVSTIQKKQKLLFGDYPNPVDSMRVDSLPVYFGYKSNVAHHNQVVYQVGGSNNQYPGVNISIEAPAGGQTPTNAASITWAHNDSTVITWSYEKFSFSGTDEFTGITQPPVFSYKANDDAKVKVETPTAGAINIVNGKAVSLYMTNGGVYKEYGRFWSGGLIVPEQATDPKFKFFEQLAIEQPSIYVKAIVDASIVLDGGRVKVLFTSTNPGKGYTAIPNVRFKLHTTTTGDSVLTNANLKVNLLAGGGLSIDPLVLDDWYTSTTGFSILENPVFGTYKRNGAIAGGNPYISTAATLTYKVDLLNGLKITDGGLGYKTAPKVRIVNNAAKQGTSGFAWQTVAEAATTLDASGRIIAVADPVMLDNFKFASTDMGWMDHSIFQNANQVSVPVDVTGLAQANARAVVTDGAITGIVLFNETLSAWYASTSASYFSGKGYITTPKVKVTPVGKTSVAKPAVLQAVVGNDGRINNIIIVNGGLGYDVKNNSVAVTTVPNLISTITTNGSSDFVYNINMGSGWHGPASSSIF